MNAVPEGTTALIDFLDVAPVADSDDVEMNVSVSSKKSMPKEYPAFAEFTNMDSVKDSPTNGNRMGLLTTAAVASAPRVID
jgi:hypothetical protein